MSELVCQVARLVDGALVNDAIAVSQKVPLLEQTVCAGCACGSTQQFAKVAGDVTLDYAIQYLNQSLNRERTRPYGREVLNELRPADSSR